MGEIPAALSSPLSSPAQRSSLVNPLDFFLLAVVLLADFRVSFFGLTENASGYYSLRKEEI